MSELSHEFKGGWEKSYAGDTRLWSDHGAEYWRGRYCLSDELRLTKEDSLSENLLWRSNIALRTYV
jgi:hypothetical protein